MPEPEKRITPESQEFSPDAVKETHARVEHHHKQRTTGNKVFDLLVYPTIAFGVVFAWSAWAMHATKYGNGWWKNQFEKMVGRATRSYTEMEEGKEVTKYVWNNDPSKTTKAYAKFHKIDLEAAKASGPIKFDKNVQHTDPGNAALAALVKAENKAQHMVEVLVSFAAGTVLISPIEFFERCRGRISHAIDRVFGTVPEDVTQYQQEPKQTWKSLMGGRAITFATVLAGSQLLGKKINSASQAFGHWVAGGKTYLTEARSVYVHGNPPSSLRMQEVMESPKYEKMRKIGYVSAFEGMYTAYCAVAVYFLSRAIAKMQGKKKTQEAETAAERIEKVVNVETAASDESGAPEKRKTWAKEAAAASRAEQVEKSRQGRDDALAVG